jgi:hypothetical protein
MKMIYGGTLNLQTARLWKSIKRRIFEIAKKGFILTLIEPEVDINLINEA